MPTYTSLDDEHWVQLVEELSQYNVKLDSYDIQYNGVNYFEVRGFDITTIIDPPADAYLNFCTAPPDREHDLKWDVMSLIFYDDNTEIIAHINCIRRNYFNFKLQRGCFVDIVNPTLLKSIDNMHNTDSFQHGGCMRLPESVETVIIDCMNANNIAWFGIDNPIPNVNGINDDVLDAIKNDGENIYEHINANMRSDINLSLPNRLNEHINMAWWRVEEDWCMW